MISSTRPFDRNSALDRILAGRQPATTLEAATRPTLTADEDAFLDTLRLWCLDDHMAARIEASTQIPDDLIDQLDRLGAFRITIPRRYGGLGFSDACLLGAVGILSALHATLCEVVAAHQVVGAVRPLMMFGTGEQRDQYLPELLHTASAFALNEADLGYGVGPLSTTAWFDTDGGCYRVCGAKTWITNATIATHAIVLIDLAATPNTPGGVTAILVRFDDEGVNRGPQNRFAGLHGLPNGQLQFDDARIPADRVIGGEGKGVEVALTCLAQCRAALPVVCLTTVKGCLQKACLWAREERQIVRGLLTNPQIQDHLADLTTTALIANAVTWFALDQRCAPLDADAAKLIVSELATHATDVLLQLVGGRGYETADSAIARAKPPNHIERAWRDTRVARIFDSSTEMLKDLFAQPFEHPRDTAGVPDSPEPGATESWIANLSHRISRRLRDAPHDAHQRAAAVDCALDLFAAHCVDRYRTHLEEDDEPATPAWDVVLDQLHSKAEGHLRRMNDLSRHTVCASLAAQLADTTIYRAAAFSRPLTEIGVER